VDDLADACVFLMNSYSDSEPVNIGWGEDVSVEELARLVAAATGFRGRLRFDSSKPDGTPRKLLDVARMTALGWTAGIKLDDGVRSTIDWYRQHVARARLVRLDN
jgi:GDP-L-fucose synthase